MSWDRDLVAAAHERVMYRERNLLALSLLVAECADLPRFAWDANDLVSFGLTADDVEPAGAVAWDGRLRRVLAG
jgi:hypothetical protein